MSLEIDVELLREFDTHLDPRHPESSRIPAQVLGYGEISTVFEIGDESQRDIAYKRLPLFESERELETYVELFDRYGRVLTDDVGLTLPETSRASITTDDGRLVFFIAQRKLDAASIGNNAIHVLSPDDTVRLVLRVLSELHKVWAFNARSEGIELGIDGQISNWSIQGFDPCNPRLGEEVRLLYLDTSTPFMRLEGTEQLDPELFLRSAPSFLLWLLRLLFLEDVMTRYYDFHLVAVDLIANFFKEQLPERIEPLIEAANGFFSSESPELGLEPITFKEVKSYYREDAIIWRSYLAMRRLDRFLRTRVARKDYPYILPGKIKR